MTVKYVVSIAGKLLYFDGDRNPAPQFPHQAASKDEKPAVKLVPTEKHPAASSQWDEALKEFTSQQRAAAEISEVAS
ncbi:MAG: hypothetical protein WKG52_07250 [Variovorax sp.]